MQRTNILFYYSSEDWFIPKSEPEFISSQQQRFNFEKQKEVIVAPHRVPLKFVSPPLLPNKLWLVCSVLYHWRFYANVEYVCISPISAP